jgi:8-oxo-dGTP diphosphatase
LTLSVPPPRPQLAVSATIFRDGQILLVRRAHAPGKGLYSLPGGRVEFGESLHDLIMSFAARWIANEPHLNDEHDDFKWLLPDALGDLQFTVSLGEVITAARRVIDA